MHQELRQVKKPRMDKWRRQLNEIQKAHEKAYALQINALANDFLASLRPVGGNNN